MVTLTPTRNVTEYTGISTVTLTPTRSVTVHTNIHSHTNANQEHYTLHRNIHGHSNTNQERYTVHRNIYSHTNTKGQIIQKHPCMLTARPENPGERTDTWACSHCSVLTSPASRDSGRVRWPGSRHTVQNRASCIAGIKRQLFSDLPVALMFSDRGRRNLYDFLTLSV